MPGRFLSIFKPLGRVLPEIKKPERKVSFNEKIFWTGLVLIIYLVMAQIPLYGISSTAESQFSSLRVIFASNSGTLMQLGIGPIVTAGLILQLLAGSSIIECDMSNAEDRGLFTSASKVFTILLTGIQAAAYLISGMFGSITGTATVVIFLELLSAGIIVMLMDELVQKGWGLGSGISLFIMAGVAQSVLWDTFSPTNGLFVGSLSAYLGHTQKLFNWVFGSVSGVYPSLLGFFATIAVFLVVIYLQGIRIELPMSYAGYKGFRSKYPIKLLYVSNLPVIFASALFANVYFFAQLLWGTQGRPSPASSSLLFKIIGQFNVSSSGTVSPVGGLAWLVTAPTNIEQVGAAPLRAAAYLGILVAFCAVFSLIWLEVGGLGPAKVARQLMDSGMQIPGYRRSGRPIESVLKRYIPVVTVLGGIIVGFVAASADFLGAFGTGTGILLSVGIIYQYYELLMKERAAEMYPAFRRLLGE
jgi:preprotein translocase subunit SecY/protein transport protein SEC61 subunit alpha